MAQLSGLKIPTAKVFAPVCADDESSASCSCGVPIQYGLDFRGRLFSVHVSANFDAALFWLTREVAIRPDTDPDITMPGSTWIAGTGLPVGCACKHANQRLEHTLKGPFSASSRGRERK